ncbi:hypothetical protein PROFUN_05443 [Planoprotostelium fungivorum]|uniref:FUN14 family protein n=1 Tax=Planoprotostelium fungivorum TaxID=1890364 RepID=A0A2P6NQR3_9EUKA|nr:hypothetical protein PROFUN_05443 [Planoprotostelium fungivorum]
MSTLAFRSLHQLSQRTNLLRQTNVLRPTATFTRNNFNSTKTSFQNVRTFQTFSPVTQKTDFATIDLKADRVKESRYHWLVLGAAALAGSQLIGGDVLAAAEEDASEEPANEETSPLEDPAVPESTGWIYEIFGNLTLGGILGFCAGFAAKKSFKLVLFFVGGEFVFLQMLAYMGYITINWGRVEDKSKLMLSKENRNKTTKKASAMLTYSLPLQAGVVGGFWAGWKYAY